MKNPTLLCAALAAMSCRTVAPQAPAAETKIVGGVEVAPEDPVFRVTVAFVKAKPSPYVTCTGTLVAPHAILTAAHCEIEPGDKVGFGLQTSPGANAVTVTQVVAHPCYAQNELEWDLAVARFDGDVPEGFGPPAPLASVGQRPVGTAVVAVGYGQTTGFPSPLDGKLRKVPLEVVTDDAMSPWLIGTLGTNGEGGRSTCHGDSGGPLYLASGALVGVTRGGPSREVVDCYELSYFDDAPKRADWINAAIAGQAPAVEPQTCVSRFDRAKIPPPLNDDKRGPEECRLMVDEPVDVVKVEQTWAFPEGYWDNPAQPVSLEAAYSAPARVQKIRVTRAGGGGAQELLPVASGKGRNCFVHAPQLPIGVQEYTWEAVGNPDKGAYTLQRRVLDQSPP